MEYPNKYLQRSIGEMGMTLLYPPDVNGWTGYRAWINSITLPIRKLLATTLVDEKVGDNRIKFEANMVEIASGMSDSQNARQLVKDFALVFFGLPLVEVANSDQAGLFQAVQRVSVSGGDSSTAHKRKFHFIAGSHSKILFCRLSFRIDNAGSSPALT